MVKADSNEFLNVTDATNAMELLVTRHKVDFIVGGFRSEAVLAMQDIAMDYKTIFIGCGAAHPELCLRVAKDYDTYKYFFRGTPFHSRFLVRTCFIQMATVGTILKKSLGIEKVKVAIAAEKAMWVDPMIKAAEGFIPKMGMEVVGVWRPSPVATDVTAELSAIQRSGAHMIFTMFSSSVGIPFARQAGELKIPAAQVGINVEAQKEGFWDATQGQGNYVMTLNTYCPGVEYNELTKPFMDAYTKKYGEPPTYTADTYAAIMYAIVPAVEKVGLAGCGQDWWPSWKTMSTWCLPEKWPISKMKKAVTFTICSWGPGYLDQPRCPVAGRQADRCLAQQVEGRRRCAGNYLQGYSALQDRSLDH